MCVLPGGLHLLQRLTMTYALQHRKIVKILHR